MKTIKIATIDGNNVNYLCISNPNGSDIITYADADFDAKNLTELAEIAEYDILDEDLEKHIQETLMCNPNLSQCRNGEYDMISGELKWK